MAYTQIYTGDGKGKTTAALGLLLRAAGADLRVAVFQFLKKGEYSELRTLADRFSEVRVEQLGSGRFITDPKNIPPEELALAREGFARAREAVCGGAYDLVILDEALGAVGLGLLREEELLALMREKAADTELVLTGRGASDALIAACDLCTEMRARKHYYEAGVQARRGIEF